MWRVECGVWSVECGVWSVACGVWSVECGVWSVECGVWSVECWGVGRDLEDRLVVANGCLHLLPFLDQCDLPPTRILRCPTPPISLCTGKTRVTHGSTLLVRRNYSSLGQPAVPARLRASTTCYRQPASQPQAVCTSFHSLISAIFLPLASCEFSSLDYLNAQTQHQWMTHLLVGGVGTPHQ